MNSIGTFNIGPHCIAHAPGNSAARISRETFTPETVAQDFAHRALGVMAFFAPAGGTAGQPDYEGQDV